ncbi:MAG: cold shock domain-containing protein [Acidiferrobacterales bacterium]|nr:cold shock domain-containing protein [Acidiferrobacterales bacterium]
MSKVIAIYGKTCCLKSDVARAISRLTGYKLASRGEAVTTQALMHKLANGNEVDLDFHKQLDERTRSMLSWPDPVVILESRFIDSVLGSHDDVFYVHVKSGDEVRNERWMHRREEGGGRTRQIGEGVAQRDSDDEALREQLYPDVSQVKPNMSIDTTEGDVYGYAVQIWSTFTGEDLQHLVDSAGQVMDKKQTKGLKPGPATGTVAIYNALRNPFGGYITDDESGRKVFIHKSAVESAGFGELHIDQRVAYRIVEDGFGGFRAVEIQNQ